MYDFLKKITLIFVLFILIFYINKNKNLDKNNYFNFNRNFESSEQITVFFKCEIKKSFISIDLEGDLTTQENKFAFNLFKRQEKQIEAGCDDTYFWYWSKNEQPNTLFYSKKEYISDVFDKNFNIKWFLGTLQNSKFESYDEENDDFYIKKVFEKDLTFIYFTNKTNKQTSMYQLWEKENKLIEAKVISNSEIEYNLLEKKIKIKIKIKDAIKHKVGDSIFFPPFYKYKILNEMIPIYQEPF